MNIILKQEPIIKEDTYHHFCKAHAYRFRITDTQVRFSYPARSWSEDKPVSSLAIDHITCSNFLS